jgi:uncharacterized membrane protein YqhA
MENKTITINVGEVTPAEAQEIVTILTGILLPALIAVANQSHWSKKARLLVAVVLSFVCAGIEMSALGNLSISDVFLTGLKLVAISAISYRNFWKKLGVDALEEKTTFGDSASFEPGEESR